MPRTLLLRDRLVGDPPPTQRRTLRLLLRCCLLAVGTLILTQRSADAQCIGCPPEDDDNDPPSITILPTSTTLNGIDPRQTLNVTIEWCDNTTLIATTRSITFRGQDVTSSFTYTTGSRTGCGAFARSVGVVTLQPGSNQLTAKIRDVYQNLGSNSRTYTYSQVSPPVYAIGVTPDAHRVGVLAGTAKVQRFHVRNTGTTTESYTFTAACTWGSSAIACTRSPTSATVAPDGIIAVDVGYTAGASGSGRISLKATRTGHSTPADTGWVVVTLGTVQSPTVVVADVNPQVTLERDLCLTAAAGADAASECGDLRLGHALPATRTLNRWRTPTLLYNSQHASPRPLIAAAVGLPASAASPDSVVALLQVAGVTRGRGSWPGSDFAPGSASRIVVADTVSTTQQLYRYTLQVMSHYGGGSASASVPVSAILVNRSTSAFGAGWWLAGLEHLVPFGTDSLLWIGGDGSARIYAPQSSTIWRAPAVDRPDSIVLVGTEYVRYGPHRLEVWLDAQGRHVRTRNRLGHTTRFYYTSANTRPDSITLPPDGSGRVYRFHYGATTQKLDSVTAPPIGSIRRVTRLHWTGARVDSITDPDTSRVRFLYESSSNRIVRRTDRRLVATVYAYDAGKRLKQASTAMGGTDSLRTRFRSLESRGIANGGIYPLAPDTAVAYGQIDGPRTDLGDTTQFWLDRFGAPRRIRSALGDSTLLERTNPSFPALVTAVRAPNGLVSQASYDARGNLHTGTILGPYGVAGQNAVTRYEWDSTWDFVTRIVPPMGDSTVIDYDPLTGNRRWQQDARGQPSRVSFSYTATGQLREIDPPEAAPGRLYYDGLGNLDSVKTSLGFRTRYVTDPVGRVIRTITPAAGGDTVVVEVVYDIMGRELTRSTKGPAASYVRRIGPSQISETKSVPGDTVVVRHRYDQEGNLLSVVTRAVPNRVGIDSALTQWIHDNVGRVIAEIAPDGRRDTTIYDPAGNVRWRITRRDHTITMEYDALNRPSRRILPTVVYGGQTWTLNGEQWRFPRFIAASDGGLTVTNTAGTGMTIRGDTVAFAYDASGNIRAASNRDARIARGYYPSGALRADTLRIRTYVGTDTTSHVYVLRHTYDLNGRRVKTHYPAKVAPWVFGVLKDSVRYTYDLTGQLDTVVGLLGETYEHDYDATGRLSILKYPGSGIEYFGYDGDDRLVRRRTLYGGAAIQNDTLQYDPRGKVTWVDAVTGLTESAYSGLGALVYSQNWRDDLPGLQPIEEHRSDALGNERFATRIVDHKSISAEQGYTYHEYHPHTGRLKRYGVTEDSTSISLAADSTHIVYDESGNKSRSFGERLEQIGEYTGNLVDISTYYYDAEDRLRLVDRRTCLFKPSCDPNLQTEYADRSAFEEMRYDPFGRRILLRTRSNWACSTRCDQTTRRFIWDGDRLLIEISARGHTGAYAVEVEADTGFIIPFDTSHLALGRVVYVYGAALDHPLSLVRTDYSDSLPEPFLLVPHADWRGQYETGRFSGGSGDHCTMLWMRVGPQIDPPELDWVEYCVDVSWPAPYKWMTHKQRERGAFGPKAWFGSLIEGKRDVSGQIYMRNRYYDPDAGRFTQEDPIGLAGGLNLYGYAGGDPVNYSDPFGLCPVCPFLVAAWAAYEVGSAAYDAYQAYKTVRDPNASGGQKAMVVGLALSGAVLPGGGYTALDDLAAAAKIIDRGGLTAAGRSLTKHAAGQRSGSRLFPRLSGNADEINAAAQEIVEDILTHPDTKSSLITTGRFKGGTEYFDPSGRGIRYDSNGRFVGFVEKR